MTRLQPAAPPLPRLRKQPERRWWRVGVSALGAIVAATISISAAASGYLGEPIRKAVESAPVIGPVVERVVARRTLAHAPRLVARAKAAHPVVASTLPATLVAPLDPVERRAERRRAMRERLATDPRAQQWLAEHPRAAARIARNAILREQGAADPDTGTGWRPVRERLGLSPRPQPGDPGFRAGPRAERLERLRMMRERRQRRIMDRMATGDPQAE
jgi:hypothetical protein